MVALRSVELHVLRGLEHQVAVLHPQRRLRRLAVRKDRQGQEEGESRLQETYRQLSPL
jgi:hypothetical protein